MRPFRELAVIVLAFLGGMLVENSLYPPLWEVNDPACGRGYIDILCPEEPFCGPYGDVNAGGPVSAIDLTNVPASCILNVGNINFRLGSFTYPEFNP